MNSPKEPDSKKPPLQQLRSDEILHRESALVTASLETPAKIRELCGATTTLTFPVLGLLK